MKMFAYYLPQFHCIPENDLWWGKGFTEWTNVKKAEPLYKGHVQPKHPLNDNYYSLDDINTLKWQKQLLDDYKIDGLIFYHYYFTGKKLLEKPAEMLLENKDLDIKYFFCWANHSWFKSWDGTKKLLLEQTYGKEKEWEDHFQYLLPFFKDKRYQKEDNKPIFMIFISDFKEKREMFDFFNRRCIESGFNGICLIEKLESYSMDKINKFSKEICNCTEYIHLREPGAVQNRYLHQISHINKMFMLKVNSILKINQKKVKVYNGNKLFNLMARNYKFDKKIVRGLFFEWDNTPRHAKRGYVITPPSKEEFINYMESIKDDKYLFINAWNEWCEGMMLEPTEENKYKYLEWIKEWKEK